LWALPGTFMRGRWTNKSTKQGANLLARLRGTIWAFEDRLSVREQIALGTAALCLFVSFAIAFGAAYVGRQEAARLISREMIQISETASDRMDRHFQNIYHRVRSYTHFDGIRSAVSTDPRKLRPSFDRLNASFPDYTWLAFVSKDGVVVAASDGFRENENVAEEAWFLKGLQGSAIEDAPDFAALEVAVSSGKDVAVSFVKFAFPVYNYNNELAGVLVAAIHWREIEEIRSAMERNGDEIVVVTRAGEVLLGSKELRKHYPSAQIANLRRTKHDVFVDRSAGREMLSGYSAMDGHRDFPGMGWGVIARRSSETAFAAMGQMFWTIVGIGTVVAILGILLAGVIAKRVSGPITELTKAADRIGRDNGVTSLPRLRGSSEVIHLSTSLRSLLLRIGFVERMTQQAEAKAAEEAKKFESDIASLRKLAETDPLTNLMNRRAFMGAASDAMRYYQRYGRAIATLIVDIDHFKRVNDQHGHAAGDAVIRRIGELIAQTLRETDKVARFGGEEFVVLLREVSEHDAHELAERIRLIIAESAIPFDGKELSVTVSIGCAAITAHDRDVEELIERADRALYAAKGAGRNCIRLAPPQTGKNVRAA
jgi:diguanylate cyclase (GGDEF)-like protein